MLFLDEMLSIIDKSGGFSGDQVKVLNLVIFELIYSRKVLKQRQYFSNSVPTMIRAAMQQ